MSMIRSLPLVAALLATYSAGCGEDSPSAPQASANAVPDFAVVDVNATSPRYDEAVSPRDYLERVSAWYFGHAT